MRQGYGSPLQIEVRWDGVVATVTATGELDLATAPGLMERLQKVAKAHPERLVLDLGGLVFVDVAGARALAATHQLLEAECPVILRHPRPSVRKVFGLTGLDGGSGGWPSQLFGVTSSPVRQRSFARVTIRAAVVEPAAILGWLLRAMPANLPGTAAPEQGSNRHG